MGVSKGPINLGKRLRMGLRPSVGAGMTGQGPVVTPSAMPMMKKGGKVKKECDGGGMKKGGAVSKHKGTKNGHHRMRSSGVKKMHHGKK